MKIEQKLAADEPSDSQSIEVVEMVR